MSRFTIIPAEEVIAAGRFFTGDTVTITIIDLITSIAESLDNDVCIEIGTTGVFNWSFGDLTTMPTSFKEYLFIMVNQDGCTQIDRVEIGGWPDRIVDLLINQLFDFFDGNGINMVTITIFEGPASTTPIPDVAVQILNSTETLLIAQGQTNSNGIVQFNLNDDDYVVRLRKAAVTFDASIPITVVGDVEFTFFGITLNIGIPIDVNTNRVFLFVVEPDGFLPIKCGDIFPIYQIQNPPFIIGNKVFDGEPNEGVYDENTGLLFFDVPFGATVRFTIPEIGIDITKVIPAVVSIHLLSIG